VDNVELSIKRAQKLLKTPENNENYISIKIKPISGGCCCFHCWPYAWKNISKEIAHYGQLKDEGDIAIGIGDDKFVLECHESGPELIVYIGIGITSVNLVASILNLITTIIRSRQQEKIGTQFKITKRVIKKTKVIEENVLEVDFPISNENVALLNKRIKDILKGE